MIYDGDESLTHNFTTLRVDQLQPTFISTVSHSV